MAINIIEEVQKKLSLPELQKIDPNTQKVKEMPDMTAENYLGQAAIPTVLIGLYKYSRTKEGNTDILERELSGNLLPIIFGETKNSVISTIAAYTNNSTEETDNIMEVIASVCVKVIREQLNGHNTDGAVRKFLTDQRSDILKVLPADLQIGKILNDETIDDKTHKMEGPVSDAMHWIEKLFSSSDPKKEENF